MEQLGSLIVSNTLDGQKKEVFRRAARGIIKNGDEVLMIHCSYFDDYTFPGGGVEEGEDPLVTLTRECQEESGVIVKNIIPFYKILEKREINEESYMLHESLFYLCDINGYCPTRLESYEIELGYSAVWIKIDEAIRLDEIRMNSLKDTDYKGVLERELRILKALKAAEN